MSKILFIMFFVSFVVFAQQRPNKNLENKFRLAQTYFNSGDFEKAEEILKEITAKAPWNFRYSEELNKVFLKQRKYDESIQILGKRISQAPNDINPYGLLGSTYYQMGQREKGDEIWGKGLEVAGINVVAFRIMANYAIQERAYGKAIEFLQTAQSKFNDGNIYLYDIAYLQSIMMKFEDAAKTYCELLIDKPNNIESVKNRMSSYINRAQALEQTIKAVNEFQENDFNAVILELQSYLEVQNENYGNALSLLIRHDAELIKNGSKVFQFANRAFNDAQYQASLNGFKYIIDTYSNSAFLNGSKIKYARSKEFLLDEQYGINQTKWNRYSPKTFPPPKQYLELIEDYNEFTINSKNRLLTGEAFFQIGKIYLFKLNDYEKALQSFNYVMLNLPGTDFAIQSALILAEKEVKRGNLKQAEILLNSVIRNPHSKEELKNIARFRLSKIEFWNGNFQKSIDRLAHFQNNYKDNMANNAIELSMLITIFRKDSLNLAKFAYASYLAEADSFNKSAEIFRELSEDENLFILNSYSKFNYVQVLIALGKIPIAIATLEEIVNSEEKNIYSDDAQFLLANAYFYSLKNYKKSKDIFENLLQDFPNSLYLEQAREMINRIGNSENKEI